MITKEQITSAANADSAELLKQGVSSHTAGVSRCAFIAGAKWAVSHLEAENAELRAALIDCVGLIDAFMVETLNQPFPANNAPEIIQTAREILEK